MRYLLMLAAAASLAACHSRSEEEVGAAPERGDTTAVITADTTATPTDTTMGQTPGVDTTAFDTTAVDTTAMPQDQGMTPDTSGVSADTTGMTPSVDTTTTDTTGAAGQYDTTGAVPDTTNQ